MSVYTMGQNCGFSIGSGNKCGNPACHHWGSVVFCCDHFDQFVAGLFDTRAAVNERRHVDVVEEYNRKTKQTSVIPGAPCDSEKKKPGAGE